MRWSTSATNTDAELSIAPRMSVMVSVTLGDVPAACHNARNVSASSGWHSRIKKEFAMSDKSIYVLWCGWNADRNPPLSALIKGAGEDAVKPHLPQLRKRVVIRLTNSSCCVGFCQPLRSAAPLPVDGARLTQVDSPHFPKPTPVRRHLPVHPLKFGASYLGHCRQ